MDQRRKVHVVGLNDAMEVWVFSIRVEADVEGATSDAPFPTLTPTQFVDALYANAELLQMRESERR